MAALQLKEDSATGQLTMRSPLGARLGGSAFGLIWIILLGAFFLLPMLGSGNIDWSNLLFVLVIFGFSGGSSLLSALTSTTVTIDRGNRTLSSAVNLVMFPLRSTTLAFADLANVEVQYYRQSSGRASHDAWRVNAIDKDGKRIPLNWDGKQSEMADLAQKIVALTGAPLLDNSAKPESTMQRMFEKVMPPAMTQPASGQSDSIPANTFTPVDQAPVIDQPAAIPPMPMSDPYASPVGDAASTMIDQMSAETAPDLSQLSISELENRIAGDTMDSDARYVLARKYHAQGQLDRAVALYQEVMRTDPTNNGAQNDLGVALQQRGKRTDAEAAYRRAIALDPFSSTAHLNLALLLRDMKRATEASQEFFQARQNARGDAEARVAEAASTGAKMEPRMSRT